MLAFKVSIKKNFQSTTGYLFTTTVELPLGSAKNYVKNTLSYELYKQHEILSLTADAGFIGVHDTGKYCINNMKLPKTGRFRNRTLEVRSSSILG